MVQCTEIYNNSCLRCSALNKKMVCVGVLYFCNDCWTQIFKGTNQIKPGSEYYTIYHEWLKLHKQGGQHD